MSLAWLVQDLLDRTTSGVKVSQQDYQSWAAGFIFEGLRNQRYGQSFCNRFAIRDYSLFYMRSVTQADAHIRKYYVIRNSIQPV